MYRVGIGWKAKARQRFGRAARSSRNAGSRRRLSFQSLARQSLAGLRRIYDLTWKQILWPDYAAAWYRPAWKCAAGLVAGNRYDAVITVSNPFTGHRVGLALKQRFPSLRWVADIGDPFSIHDKFRSNNWLLYRRRNARLEHNVLQNADGVTVVTQTMTETYRQLFPAAADHIHCVQPLVGEAVMTPVATDPLPTTPRRIAYFGTLYRGLRSPTPLLKLFEQLTARPDVDDLQLHFYGNIGDCAGEFEPYAQWFGTRIHLHGPVARDAVPDAMRQSHVLVNLGNDLPYGLPSKTVEYAATGRPILNVAVCREDTAATFLQRYPSAHTVFLDDMRNHARKTVAATAAFLNDPPPVTRGDIARLLQPHRVEAVAQQYERVLTSESHANRRAA